MSTILFWSAGDDGSSWYRCTLPAESLMWSGHQVAVGQTVTSEVIEKADVIVGSRIAGLRPHRVWMDLAAKPAGQRPRLVLDLDDDYWALDPSNPAAAGWPPSQLDRLRSATRAADAVSVASQALAEVVRAQTGVDASKVHVVPNGLHAAILGWPRDYEADQRELIVGWSGTASSARDLDLVARPLARIVEYGDGQVKLRLVGLPNGHPIIGQLARAIPKRLHDLVEGVAWVPHGAPYLAVCAAFDIWVAPYRSSPFVDAKFPTKALEAGTLGIPLIASDTRPYREWDGGNTVLVDEHQPWVWGRTLKRLVDEPDLRRRVGESARSRAAMNIMQSLGHRWAEVLGL